MLNNKLLFSKLKEFEDRLKVLENQMSDSEIIKNVSGYRKLAIERADLLDKIALFTNYKNNYEEISRLDTIIQESAEEEDFLELVEEELKVLKGKQSKLTENIEEFLIEPDPNDKKDIIIEIRAGTGGEEAALFAADLYRMYAYYADKCGIKVEVINSSPTPIGGFKEIIFSLEGINVYKRFKFESGIHRVQRVPSTETSGRIHTSAVSVAVLPAAEEMDIEIKLNDLKVDVYRSSGAGGQSVNTTDSAVRITHLPTGVVVTCQDERSQIKNRAKALKVLRARLYDHALSEQASKISKDRKQQVGSGDRSEKIRTYNFPDRRVTDHRISLTLYRIEQILAGDLDELIAALQTAEKELKLQQQK
ncbi:MAG: peptide chain release factor 1 [Candidatus Omnitrophica bacterium]|nr:peptide chain release factor 1 [Candidatus Omnitrophota bacterium]